MSGLIDWGIPTPVFIFLLSSPAFFEDSLASGEGCNSLVRFDLLELFCLLFWKIPQLLGRLFGLSLNFIDEWLVR
jgi:hypothetical protein